MKAFKILLEEVLSCQICAASLPLGARPVLQAHLVPASLLLGKHLAGEFMRAGFRSTTPVAIDFECG